MQLVLRAAHAVLDLVRPEEHDDVRVGVQPEQRVAQLRVYHNTRFDLLPIKVVGLRHGNIVADDADWLEGNSGRAGHVLFAVVEEAAEAGKHAPQVSRWRKGRHAGA